ncbi:MAG: hypothetical protein ACK5JT_14620 [Hyphomicrobiaceae bacterium]
MVMHAVIYACLELRAAHKLEAAMIDRVTVTGDALLEKRADRIETNARDTRVSTHHAAAAAFLWGRAGIAEFSDPKAMSDEAAAFRSKVSAQRDDSLPQGAARVQVRLKDGRELETTVLAARGSLQQPLTDRDIEAKVRELVHGAGTGLDADRVIGCVWDLDQAPNINGLLAAVVARRT